LRKGGGEKSNLPLKEEKRKREKIVPPLSILRPSERRGEKDFLQIWKKKDSCCLPLNSDGERKKKCPYFTEKKPGGRGRDPLRHCGRGEICPKRSGGEKEGRPLLFVAVERKGEGPITRGRGKKGREFSYFIFLERKGCKSEN